MAIRNYIFGLFIILCSCQTILSQTATVCAGVPDGSFVRNSNSCRAYYYCSNGTAHPSQCPEIYLFEPVRQICHLPSYVQCTGCSPFGVHHIAHPSDCSSYYLCVSGIRTLRRCEGNLIFDKSIGDCNVAGSVQCIRDYTQICAEFGGYVKIGDPNDCSKYFTCYYGEAYHQACAPGLFFKPAIASCTFPEEYDFCQGDGPIILSSDNQKDELPMSLGNNSNEYYIILPTDNHSEGTGGNNNSEEPSDNNDEEPSDNNDEEPSDNNDEEPSDNNDEEPNDNNSEEPNDNNSEEPSDNNSHEHSDNDTEEHSEEDSNNENASEYNSGEQIENNEDEPSVDEHSDNDNEKLDEEPSDNHYDYMDDYNLEPPTPKPLQ